MVANRVYGTALVGAVALSLVALGPVDAASTKPITKRRGANSVSLLGNFTPAAADPKFAAALSRSGFRFTPSATPGARRAVTVAVRARGPAHTEATRVEAQGASEIAAITVAPTAYNLGVSVGWKRFALSGDLAKVDSGVMPGGHEAMDLGVAYLGKRWSTRIQLGSDRTVGEPVPALGIEETYSADLSGSYSLTHNLEVTGGVRYRLQRDRTLQPLDDGRRDSQSVYVGTAFRF